MKRLLFFSFGALCVLGIAIAAYDFIRFVPEKVALDEALLNSGHVNRKLPDMLPRLIDAANPKIGGIENLVARQMHARSTGCEGARSIQRHVEYLLWAYLLRLHVPRETIYLYYCMLAFNGLDYGADNLSVRLFSRHLDALEPSELATIVAILQVPSQYPGKISVIEGRRDELLKRVSESQ